MAVQVTYFFFLQVPLSTNYFSASLTESLRKRKEKACILSPRTNLGGIQFWRLPQVLPISIPLLLSSRSSCALRPAAACSARSSLFVGRRDLLREHSSTSHSQTNTAAAADPPSPKDSTSPRPLLAAELPAGGALPAAERAVACCCRAAQEIFHCPCCRRPGRRQTDLATVIHTATGLMQIY
ncbi:hypothetical protein GQ55_1G236500 [Panicum hallii var. hallii]|uniref:Uncharacterized protein n=1 Tax=Panicum hallii var. hallii TaxID=1504633 RepID=A0A2T7F6W2_9POAL|nr:hypothetical protein GQ55_1G236500 [Panicum hallii var. hallii]